jgi:hypothetical protein
VWLALKRVDPPNSNGAKMPKLKYRSLPEFLGEDDSFIRLSANAKGVFLTLLFRLPHTGLGRVPSGALEIYANASTELLEAALMELEAVGWLHRDGTGYLLVHGLAWQSALASGNPNHRKAITGSVESLGNSPLVKRFYDRYPEWQPNHPLHPKDSDTHSNGTRKGADSHSNPDEALKQFKSVKHTNAVTRAGRRPSREASAPQPIGHVLDAAGLRDAALRADPIVQEIVDNYKRQLNGDGETWWRRCGRAATEAGRTPVAYAYDSIVSSPDYSGPRVGL